jgi:hypothetical protein
MKKEAEWSFENLICAYQTCATRFANPTALLLRCPRIAFRPMRRVHVNSLLRELTAKARNTDYSGGRQALRWEDFPCGF